MALLTALASLTLWGGPPAIGVPATTTDLHKVKLYFMRSGPQSYTQTTLTEWCFVYLRNESDEPLIHPKFKGTMTSQGLKESGTQRRADVNSLIPGSFHGVIAPRAWSSVMLAFEFPVSVFSYGRIIDVKLTSATKITAKRPLTNPEVLRAFIQKSAPSVLTSTFQKTPSLGKVRDEVGMGPMAMAVLSGNVRKVKALESAGLSLKLDAKSRINALHLACQTNPEMTAYIKGKGVPWTKDAKNYTPLAYAVFALNPRVISALKPTKAQLNEGYGVNDHTALHDAVSLGETQTIPLLLKLGANPNALDSRGQPPVAYGYALEPDGFKKLIKLLKPDLKIRITRHKYTLLQWAMLSQAPNAVQALMSLGLSPYEKNGDGKDCFALLKLIKHPVDRRMMEAELKKFKKVKT